VSCTTDETSFIKNAAAMSMLMNHPDVDGIYETQVPHLVRALLKLGNKCNPAPKRGATLSKGLDSGFGLNDLSQPTTSLSRRSYLDGGRNMQYIYIYHSNQDSRHVLCLVLPDAGAKLYIVDKGRNRELPNMDKYYTEAKAAIEARRRADNGGKLPALLFDYPEKMAFEPSYHADPVAAYRAMSRELSGLQGRKMGPTVLAICSALPRSFYESAIPNAQTFPIVMIPSSKVDNTYPTRLLWQGPAAKRMVQHYLRLASWMKDRLEMAHKADLPM
jgi:DNA polymerase epsilon subunit 1